MTIIKFKVCMIMILLHIPKIFKTHIQIKKQFNFYYFIYYYYIIIIRISYNIIEYIMKWHSDLIAKKNKHSPIYVCTPVSLELYR